MADFFKRILSNFCAKFKKIEKLDDLNLLKTGLNEAAAELDKLGKGNKKLLDQEYSIIENLWNILGKKVDKNNLPEQFEKARKVKEELERLRKHKTIAGSVFLGVGTAKYYKEMITTADKIIKQHEYQVKESIKKQELLRKEEVLKNAQALLQNNHGRFKDFSTSCKEAKEKSGTPQFYGCKSWKEVFEKLPKEIKNKYKGGSTDEYSLKTFIDSEPWNLCPKVWTTLRGLNKKIVDICKKLNKTFSEEDLKSMNKAYIDAKKFCRRYKSDYIYNILLWGVQQTEYCTYRRLDIALPKEEQNQ